MKEPIKIAVGDILYELPPMPPKAEILNFGLPKKKQKWIRPKFTANPSESEISDIQKTDLNRRRNGVWFFNNGEATYITGNHYTFLTHWNIEANTTDGYPEYRDRQREVAYFEDYCSKDPNSYGYMFLTSRRFSKTEFHLCCIYNQITLYSGKHGALQSINEDDAKNNLFSRIVRSWKNIPFYLRPVDSGVSDPKKGLFFKEPVKMKRTQRMTTYKKVLNSFIDYQESKPSGYQGKKVHRGILDEPGSVVNMDLQAWWNTTKECVSVGRDVIGKYYLPATLENMEEKQGVAYQKLWEKSDISKKDKNNRTISGLYRLFNPAYLGAEGFQDEYGCDRINENGEYEAKIFYQNMRDNAGVDLPSVKRKYPFTVEEAFDAIVEDCWEEDVKEILKKREKFLLGANIPVKRVVFYEEGGGVNYFVSNKKDTFIILEEPQPDVKYIIGVDGSASDDMTGYSDGSEFAMTVRKGFQGMNSRNYVPVGCFSKRPEKLDYIYLQLFLAWKYFNKFGGCKVNLEGNAGQGAGVVGFFSNRGALKGICKRPKYTWNDKDKTDKYGVYRNNEVKSQQIILANRMLRLYGGDIEILEVVQSYLNYGKDNEDIADADLMAILPFADFDKPVRSMPNLKTATRPRLINYSENGFIKQKWIDVSV